MALVVVWRWSDTGFFSMAHSSPGFRYSLGISTYVRVPHHVLVSPQVVNYRGLLFCAFYTGWGGREGVPPSLCLNQAILCVPGEGFLTDSGPPLGIDCLEILVLGYFKKKKKKLQFCTSSSFLLLLGWKWCSFQLSTSQTEAGSQIWGYQVYLKLYSLYFLFLWGQLFCLFNLVSFTVFSSNIWWPLVSPLNPWISDYIG